MQKKLRELCEIVVNPRRDLEQFIGVLEEAIKKFPDILTTPIEVATFSAVNYTLLHLAVEQNALDIVHFLLLKNPDLKKIEPIYAVPLLFLAMDKGQSSTTFAIASLLLKAGVDKEKGRKLIYQSVTVLQSMLIKGNAIFAELLISEGAIPNPSWVSAMHFPDNLKACTHLENLINKKTSTKSVEFEKLESESSQMISEINNRITMFSKKVSRYNLLAEQISKLPQEQCNELLPKAKNPNFNFSKDMCIKSNTILHLAVMCGSFSLVSWVVHKYPELIRLKNDDYKTALNLAETELDKFIDSVEQQDENKKSDTFNIWNLLKSAEPYIAETPPLASRYNMINSSNGECRFPPSKFLNNQQLVDFVNAGEPTIYEENGVSFEHLDVRPYFVRQLICPELDKFNTVRELQNIFNSPQESSTYISVVTAALVLMSIYPTPASYKLLKSINCYNNESALNFHKRCWQNFIFLLRARELYAEKVEFLPIDEKPTEKILTCLSIEEIKTLPEKNRGRSLRKSKIAKEALQQAEREFIEYEDEKKKQLKAEMDERYLRYKNCGFKEGQNASPESELEERDSLNNYLNTNKGEGLHVILAPELLAEAVRLDCEQEMLYIISNNYFHKEQNCVSNYVDRHGNTALHLAKKEGAKKLVYWLLRNFPELSTKKNCAKETAGVVIQESLKIKQHKKNSTYWYDNITPPSICNTEDELIRMAEGRRNPESLLSASLFFGARNDTPVSNIVAYLIRSDFKNLETLKRLKTDLRATPTLDTFPQLIMAALVLMSLHPTNNSYCLLADAFKIGRDVILKGSSQMDPDIKQKIDENRYHELLVSYKALWMKHVLLLKARNIYAEKVKCLPVEKQPTEKNLNCLSVKSIESLSEKVWDAAAARYRPCRKGILAKAALEEAKKWAQEYEATAKKALNCEKEKIQNFSSVFFHLGSVQKTDMIFVGSSNGDGHYVPKNQGTSPS